MKAATAPLRVALAGNPNSGKSSVFNCLTGLQQKVGNFPGVTVDKKTGQLTLPSGLNAELVDLPGVYSLYPHSPDQVVTLQVLLDEHDALHPDAVLYIADSSNLERHLLLFTEIADLGIPVILCLNQLDIAEKEGLRTDEKVLANSLGVPVIRINGRTGEGLDRVLSCLTQSLVSRAEPFWKAENAAKPIVRAVKKVLPDLAAYQAVLVAHHYRLLPFVSEPARGALARELEIAGFLPLRAQVNETLARFDHLAPLVRAATRSASGTKPNQSDRIDRILTHPVYGTITFFAVLLLIFQAMFSWADLPMKLMDEGLTASRQFLADRLPASIMTDLLTDGVLPGIGGILIFIPQIAVLFLLVSLMEEVGYMARAVYLSDNLMRRFGLNGRSFVALISGVACAVPAVMTARGITNRQERMATIFVTPFMSCSARLPVFALLIAFAVPDRSTAWGLLDLQGAVMFSLYLLGAFAALASAWMIKRLFRSPEPSYLMLELPSYQAPHWRNVYTTVWIKVKLFITNAGKIILVISLVLWGLSSYGPGTSVRDTEREIRNSEEASLLEPDELESLIAARRLEASWAGQLGHLIEPAIAPLGFDWKIGIALITSFAAREVFVSTMATIYSAGDPDDKSGIIESMRKDVHSSSGLPVYTTATAISLLLFYVFAMQCMSTLAVVQRETNSWKIPVYQFLYMTGLAYGVSLLTYQVLS